MEPEHSLLKQYGALMQTEGVSLSFGEDAIRRAGGPGRRYQRPGGEYRARGGWQRCWKKLLEEVSFTASDRGGESVAVDAAYVNERVAPLAARGDLSRFIL